MGMDNESNISPFLASLMGKPCRNLNSTRKIGIPESVHNRRYLLTRDI